MDADLYDELWRVEQSHWWFQARRHIVLSLIRRYLGVSVAGAQSAKRTPDDSAIYDHAMGWLGQSVAPPHSRSAGALPAPPDRRLRICELGCGTGGNIAALADEHDVLGIECSTHALAYARRRLGNRVRPGSLPLRIDLPAESFDVVLLTDVLEHIEDDAASASAALRLARPNGIVIATVPAYQWLYSPRDARHHHFRRYARQQFHRLWTVAGGKVLLLSHYNTLLFPPAAVARLANKLLARRAETGDLSIPPPPLNQLLAQLMRSEANLLGRLPLPFGLSLIAVVQKQRTNTAKMAA